MTNKSFWVSTLSSLLVATALGCSAAPTTTTTTQAAAPEPSSIQRSVLSASDLTANLPKAISVADADRLLTTIDESKIQTENSYSVQQLRRFGWGHRGFGYGGYRYFGYRGHYFPYYRYGGFYRPFVYPRYYPYLVPVRAYYRPYACPIPY